MTYSLKLSCPIGPRKILHASNKKLKRSDTESIVWTVSFFAISYVCSLVLESYKFMNFPCKNRDFLLATSKNNAVPQSHFLLSQCQIQNIENELHMCHQTCRDENNHGYSPLSSLG